MPNLNDIAKQAAAILRYRDCVALVAKFCMHAKAPVQQAMPATPNLIGSIKIKTNNLETASQRIADSFARSIDETAGKL